MSTIGSLATLLSNGANFEVIRLKIIELTNVCRNIGEMFSDQLYTFEEYTYKKAIMVDELEYVNNVDALIENYSITRDTRIFDACIEIFIRFHINHVILDATRYAVNTGDCTLIEHILIDYDIYND